MISVTDPIQRSMDWTRKVLFSPFDLGKWCVLGFTAFLAELASGGGQMGSRNPFMPKGSGKGSWTPAQDVFEEVRTWVMGHRPLIAGIVIFLLVLLVFLQWLRARGQFMFLDNVVNDRARVAEPWTRFREHANRVFVFSLLLNLAGLAMLAAGLLWGWRVAGPDIAEGRFGAHALLGILAAAAAILPLGLVLTVIGQLLKDFVVPVMYLRGVTVGEGFQVLWREVMPGHGGSFVLFYLMKLVLALAAGVLVLFGTCLTCCLAGLPYVSSVVFLPVTVFFRGYSLQFMAQCGPQWRLLPGDH